MLQPMLTSATTSPLLEGELQQRIVRILVALRDQLPHLFNQVESLLSEDKALFDKIPLFITHFLEQKPFPTHDIRLSFFEFIRSQLTAVMFRLEFYYGAGVAVTKNSLDSFVKEVTEVLSLMRPQLPRIQPTSLMLENEHLRFQEQQQLQLSDNFQELLRRVKAYALTPATAGSSVLRYESKIIFISYAWPIADVHHEAWTMELVLNLARHLITAGLQVYLDQIQSGCGTPLRQFMDERIQAAHHVLVICDRTMTFKFSQGLTGVCHEYLQIINRLREEQLPRFIIPVCLNEKTVSPGLVGDFAEVSIYNNGYLPAVKELLTKIYGFGEHFARWWEAQLLELQLTTTVSPIVRTLPSASSSTRSARFFPEPVTESKFWEVPAYNPNFVERPVLLQQVSERLARNTLQPIVLIACHGLGGVGKSQLVLKVLYDQQDKFSKIYWVTAESRERLLLAYRLLGQDYQVFPVDTHLSDRDLIHKIKAWFEAQAKIIIHYDNAPDYEMLKEFIPNKCLALITSRNKNWPDRDNNIEVGVFTLDEARKFLRKVIPDKIASEHELDELIELLGRLPLALAQAAAYMAFVEDMTMAEYIKQCRKTMDLLGEELFIAGSQEMPKTVRTTWKITLNKIKEKCPLAVQVLTLCAFLAPDNISREIISIYLRFINAESQINHALQWLSTFSMLNYNKESGYYNVHRLVQVVMRLDYGDPSFTAIMLQAFLAYLQQTIDNADQIDLKNVFNLINHLNTLVEAMLWLSSRPNVIWPMQLQVNIARINFYLAILHKKCGFPDESEQILNMASSFLDTLKCSAPEDLSSVRLVKARVYCRQALVKIIYESNKMQDASEQYLQTLPAVAQSNDEQRLARAELLNSKAMYLLMQKDAKHADIKRLCQEASDCLNGTSCNQAFIYKTLLLCQIDQGDFAGAHDSNERFFMLSSRGLDKYSTIRYLIDKAKIFVGLDRLLEALVAINEAIRLAEHIPKRIAEAMVYRAVIEGLSDDHVAARRSIEEICNLASKSILRGVFMGTLVDQFRLQIASMTNTVEVFDLFLNKLHEYYYYMNGEHYCDTKYIKMCLDKWRKLHPAPTMNSFLQSWRLVRMAASAVSSTAYLSFYGGASTTQESSTTATNTASGQNTAAPTFDHRNS